jgi:hypothetical protein
VAVLWGAFAALDHVSVRFALVFVFLYFDFRYEIVPIAESA